MEAAVRIQEIDLSARVASFEGVFGAMVIQSKRGNTSRPSLYTNTRQFLDRVTPKGRVEVGMDLAHYSALTFLGRSDKLWVARAVNGALYGGAAIKTSSANTLNNALISGFLNPDAYVFDSQIDADAQPQVTRVTSVANTAVAGTAEVYSFTILDPAELDGNFQILPDGISGDSVAVWFNGTGSTPQPVFTADRAIEFAFSPLDSASEIAEQLGDLLDSDGALGVSINGAEILLTVPQEGEIDITLSGQGVGHELNVVTSGVNPSFSLQSKSFTIYDADGSVGVWFNVDSEGSIPLAASSADRAIEVELSGIATASEVAQALQQAIAADAAYSATFLGNQVTITDSVIGVRASASDVDTGFTITTIQQGGEIVDEEDEALLLYGSSEGAWINDIGVRITTHLDDADLVPEEGSFLLEIFRRDIPGNPLERFFCSRILGKLDGFGRNMYVEDVLQGSSLLRAINNDLVDEEIYPKSQTEILWLGAGDDGLAPTVSNMVATAQQFANPEEISVTLLMDGGFATPAYARALTAIAQSRMDCVAILSTPFSAESSSDYINALSDYRKNTLNINSSYAALYSPHVLIQDQFNDREIYISPDAFVGGAISLNANQREIWFPPAGFRRGILDVLDVRRSFESGERSTLYGIGINPIRKTQGRGIVIWGQKTLLARPSLLSRLNVRLLLIVISPALKEFLEDYLFELNDRLTRAEVEAKIADYLRNIQSRRGLTRFQVICDDTNNPPSVIDNNQMIVDVLLTPTSSVEDIPLRIVIVSNAASLSDAAQAI